MSEEENKKPMLNISLADMHELIQRAERAERMVQEERQRAERAERMVQENELEKRRIVFISQSFNDSRDFLQKLDEANFRDIRSQYLNQTVRQSRRSMNFSSQVSSTNSSSSGYGLKGSTFKVNMLRETKYAIRMKDLKFKGIEHLIKEKLFYGNDGEMDFFLNKWSEHLTDLRCAVLFHAQHFGREYEVKQTQPLIHRFIEGMISHLELNSSIAIDNSSKKISLELTKDEYKSVMGRDSEGNSDNIDVSFTVKRDLVYSFLQENSDCGPCVHFEVKRTGGIEKGKGMGPREQVIATNIVCACCECSPFVRGMAINIFAASLVWFISNSKDETPVSNGTHYIEYRVWSTRDIVLRILACLVEISFEEICDILDEESAGVVVINKDDEVVGFPTESEEYAAGREETGETGVAADEESKLPGRGIDDATNARHVSDNRLGRRSIIRGKESVSAAMSAPGGLKMGRRVEGDENMCPQQGTRTPYLSALELQKERKMF